MDIKYGVISDECLATYLTQLVNGVFKILPLHEEESETVKDYIESLQREVIGFYSLTDEPRFLKIVSTLEYLAQGEYSHSTCKREVFKCIHILEEIRDKRTPAAERCVSDE